MHNTTQTRYDTQKEKQTWKACKIGIIFWKPTNPNHQTQQNIPKPYSSIIFSNLNKNTKSKKSRLESRNTLRKIEISYLFLKIDEEMMKKIKDFLENTVSLWGRGTDKTMNNHKMQGKTALKIILKSKTRVFHDWIESRTSRQFKSPKNRVTNFEKFVLVFFMTGRSTCE